MIPNVRWWPGNNFPLALWLALLVVITERRSSLQRVIGSLSHRTGVESVVRWVRMKPRASGSCRGKLISSFNANRSQRSRVLWAILCWPFLRVMGSRRLSSTGGFGDKGHEKAAAGVDCDDAGHGGCRNSSQAERWTEMKRPLLPVELNPLWWTS